ncbi:growth arrest-specific protein 1 [Cephus cinctus]|uniref:Growth arrest-specific protein 1 n=1 Tax=Cephus cinctus TaxID=211228 RepID=A0AAJ7BRN7_CEPCN|nr:growth arrest-specific protein 1 [Cephus cinctus]XP_015592579.1 growth arrest-specific protein 1 [Cephus cinctus]
MTSSGKSMDIVLLLTVLLTICMSSTTSSRACNDIKMKCAYRSGCGAALQQYLMGCSGVLHGDVNDCPETCQHALIALTSTDEGKELMTCECAHNDYVCLQSKQRVEVCRASVTMTMNRTRVSCRIATWICIADALCSKAMDYYNTYCWKMFRGKKCTHRCHNSIAILRRQEKAAKLNTCICDGTEDYDCRGIRRNMNALCFGKVHHDYHEVKKVVGDTRTNEILRDDANLRGDGIRNLVNRVTLALTIVILLLSRQD